MTKIVTVNQLNFYNEVIESNLPVLVKFGANWCGPCYEQDLVLEKISEEYLTLLKVVNVDIDDSPDLCKSFQIGSIPTMIFYKSGNKIDTNIGFMNFKKLIDFLNSKI